MTISKLIKKLSMTVAGTAFVALSGTGIAQAITITPTSSGNDLVDEILGSGITINSVRYRGANAASGIFTDGLSSIGIDQGIILTTGTAKDAEGPNDADDTTTQNGEEGDSDLDAITASTTFDATILEFDFETEGGNLFFNYVFASEEYNEYVNSDFNDVFGFFLNGENIALIPGTNTEVAINTVNNGNPNDGGDPTPSYPEYFKNNEKNNGVSEFDIEYDGFTNVFTAQALNLGSGTHRIKLAIGDTFDRIRDSAVFIQAGSFSDQATPEGETPDVSQPPLVLGEFPTQNTPDVSEPSEETLEAPLFGGLLSEAPTQNTPEVPEPSEKTPDVSESFTSGGILGESSAQNPEDVPEPSVVIGLFAIGFAGSLLKKKSTTTNSHK